MINFICLFYMIAVIWNKASFLFEGRKYLLIKCLYHYKLETHLISESIKGARSEEGRELKITNCTLLFVQRKFAYIASPIHIDAFSYRSLLFPTGGCRGYNLVFTTTGR